MSSLKSLMSKVTRQSKAAEKPKSLPLIAFYGRDPEREDMRNRMYEVIERVMSAPDAPEDPEYFKTRSFLTGDITLVLNLQSSPLEYLVAQQEMMSDEDVMEVGGCRYHTALRLRDLVEGSRYKSVKSPDWESTGGGGFTGHDISSYQLDCIWILDRVRKAMPAAWMYPFTESVLVMDEWYDLENGDRAERRKTITALHYCLDIAAVRLNYMMPAELIQRWEGAHVSEPPAVSRRRSQTTAQDRLALRT